MWVPPIWLIYGAAYGSRWSRYASRVPTAVTTGQTTKVVRCEACRQHYAYQLRRTAAAAAGGRSEDALRAASQRAEAELQRLLATEVEAIPCPACGRYQSDMIPQARKRHRPWMVYAGQCLTVGIVPVAVFGIRLIAAQDDPPPLTWPLFVAGLVCVLAVGAGMLIRGHHLAKTFDPNEEDVGVRTLYGQSRATLLTEQEAQDARSRPVTDRPTGSAEDHKVRSGLILAIICVAGLVGCGGFLGVRALVRAGVVARFEKAMPGYVALSPAFPRNGVEQPRPPQGAVTGKVKGKMVVINADERKVDDLHFALSDDLCASKPEEVGTVVLLTWETSPTSREPLSRYGPSLYANRFIMVGHVQVFDWERKSEIASVTIPGDVPDLDPDGKTATGPKPEARVLAFLAGLPRE